MGDWWYTNIEEPGKLPLLLALASFAMTFLITRMITRLIRAGKGPFRNVQTGGGIHIHHVVPGVILTVLGGFGGVATGYGTGAIVFAVIFGIGAGLLLDEFALILHLDDVYWSEQGRKSVEAVVLTMTLVVLVLAGYAPLGVNDLSEEEVQDRRLLLLTLLVNFLLVLIALVKGKFLMAVFGVFVPFFALVGALRLARPGSPWARRAYRRRPRARARALLRSFHHDRRWVGPSRRVQDLIGGRPDPAPVRMPSGH